MFDRRTTRDVLSTDKTLQIHYQQWSQITSIIIFIHVPASLDLKLGSVSEACTLCERGI